MKAIVVSVVVLLALACKDAPTAPDALLFISPETQTLQVPRTLQLSTDNGPGSVSWESSDNGVAIVSSSGLVTAKFPGSAIVTARRGSRSATMTLTVTAARIDIGPSPAIVALNGTQSLIATARDADGAVLSGVPMKWSTGNTKIATVGEATGVVTGKGAGNTTITAFGGGTSGGVAVLVNVVLGPQLVLSSIATAGNYACALEALTGFAYCWGDNHSGALGSGDGDGSDFPLPVSGGHTFSSITVGLYSNCGLEAQTGFAYCWGYNDDGGLGDGTTTPRSVPTLVANGAIRFRSISASGDVTCGIEAQTALGYCWGRGGLIGDGTLSQRSTPTLVGGNHRFDAISTGLDVACGIETQTGLAYCWGRNNFGQLGDGTTTDRLSPTLVNGNLRLAAIDAGRNAACALEAQTGLAYCWGHNNFGQLGDGSTTDRLTPTPVSGSRGFSSITAGFDATCGIDAQTRLGYCWGGNSGGQIGDGTTVGRSVPTLVGGGNLRFSAINSSGFESCGVDSQTGFGYCWGVTVLIPSLISPPTIPQRLPVIEIARRVARTDYDVSASRN